MIHGGDPAHRPRREEQKRHRSSTTNMKAVEAFCKPSGQLMHVPGERRRQRLRLVVVAQRRQVAPGGVAAQQLHDAAEEHQAEEQPAEKPDADRANCPAKMARNPASSSRMSHWNERKS